MSDKYEDLRKIIKEELLSEGLPAYQYDSEEEQSQQVLDDEDRESLLRNSSNKDNLQLTFIEIIKKHFVGLDNPVKSLSDAILNDNELPTSEKYKIDAILKRHGLIRADKPRNAAIQNVTPESIFEDNFNRLLETEIDFVPGTKISLAGLCLLLVVTDNALKENTDLTGKERSFAKVMTYLYKHLEVNGKSIIELKKELARKPNLEISVELTNPNFDDLKKRIYSAGGFAYEIAFASLLGIDIGEEVTDSRNMNRIAPLYAYYVASLTKKGKSTSPTLRRTLKKIFDTGNNNALFENFKGAESYGNLINNLIDELKKVSKITGYVESIKNNIQQKLRSPVNYAMHKSPTGIYDIIASANNKHIKFDIKTTINDAGITEPTGKQIHKWGDETNDTLYYGIVSIIIDRINWKLPYVLQPTDINGGAVSRDAIAQDLRKLDGEDLNTVADLTYFTNSRTNRGKTIGIFKIPSSYRRNDDFKINGDNSQNLNISDIATSLNRKYRILPKSDLNRLSDKLIDAYGALIRKDQNTSKILSAPDDSAKGVTAVTWSIKANERSAIDSLALDDNEKELLKQLCVLGDFFSQLPQNNFKTLIGIKRNKVMSKGEKHYRHTIITRLIEKITSSFEQAPDNSVEREGNNDGESNNDDESQIHTVFDEEPTDEINYSEIINIFNLTDLSDEDLVENASELLSYIHKIYYTLLRADISEGNAFSALRAESCDPEGNILLERDIRLLVRRLLEEGDKKRYSGSHPEESYGWSAKEEDFMFDKPGLTTWEKDRQRVKEYLRSMGMLASKKEKKNDS